METNRIVVIDIETVAPDAEKALQPFLGSIKGGRSTDNPITQERKRQENVETAVEKAALSPVSAKILSIGAFYVESDVEAEVISPKFYFSETGDEGEILQSFRKDLQEFGKNRFSYVTFNGRNFDFPFIMFRGAVHHIPFMLPISPYNGRDNHIDMFTHLNQVAGLDKLYDYWRYTSLKRWLEYFGLGSKLSIQEGDLNLLQLFEAKQFDLIKNYQMNDVEKTFQLYKIFQSNFGQGDVIWDSKTY